MGVSSCTFEPLQASSFVPFRLRFTLRPLSSTPLFVLTSSSPPSLSLSRVPRSLQGCRHQVHQSGTSRPQRLPSRNQLPEYKNKAANPTKLLSRSQVRTFLASRVTMTGPDAIFFPTDIKASGLPAKVGFFNGLFYVRIKGGKVPQRTKTTKYIKGDEFVATWEDTVKLCVLPWGVAACG